MAWWRVALTLAAAGTCTAHIIGHALPAAAAGSALCRRAGCLAMATPALRIGDEVKVLSDQTFFHVPKQTDGFVARGLIGIVERVYDPEQDGLSPVHPIVVSFSEPRKWKAHFERDELALSSADESELPIAPVLPTKDVEMCSIREGSACDQVQDFMTPIERAVILTPDMPMRVAAELLSKNGITGAPVAIGGKLVGVLTQFDFLYLETRPAASQLDSGAWSAQVRKRLASTVRGAMSNPVAVAPGSDMSSVAGLMVRKRFNHLPVVAETGDIVGILTSLDVLRHVLLRLSDGADATPKLAATGKTQTAAEPKAQEEASASAA